MTEILEPPLFEVTPESGREISLAQTRKIIQDLFEHRASLYWTDLLISLTVAYGAVAVYLTSARFSLPYFIAFVVAGFALFRCGVFIHEIVHMPADRLRLFRVGWNILFAVPNLMPSFAYKSHGEHHNPRLYGTSRDGEYLPLGAGPVSGLVVYLLQLPLLPALAICRFLVLTPVSFLHPRLRRWVLERASSLVINPRYRRVLPADERRGTWVALEIAIFVELAAFLGLLLSGRLPWTVFAELYVLGMFAAGLNWMRTLAAHRYRNTGSRMTFGEQIEDSINVSGHPLLTELLFPVGLRYHALHHLFPALPYHSLGTAHRRLMASLPPDSPYRRTVRRSYLQVMRAMWRGVRSTDVAGSYERAADEIQGDGHQRQ
jgi:fatty acid desaturase